MVQCLQKYRRTRLCRLSSSSFSANQYVCQILCDLHRHGLAPMRGSLRGHFFWFTICISSVRCGRGTRSAPGEAVSEILCGAILCTTLQKRLLIQGEGDGTELYSLHWTSSNFLKSLRLTFHYTHSIWRMSFRRKQTSDKGLCEWLMFFPVLDSQKWLPFTTACGGQSAMVKLVHIEKIVVAYWHGRVQITRER